MRTVIITGVNRGIGLVLANKFLAEGFEVIGTSRKVMFSLISNVHFHFVQLDVTCSESIVKAVEYINSRFTKIDILINNAGVGMDLHSESPEIDILRATFETNVFGLFSWTEAIKDTIQNSGIIFNVSSIMGVLNREKSLPNATAYRMSKSALNMYTKTLAARLQNRGVKVVSIHPGWVKTDMGGQEATISAESCADGIYQLFLKEVPTNSFWDAETQTQLNW